MFIQQCGLCGCPSTARLCAQCAALLPALGPACARCAIPTPVAVEACGACQRQPPAFDAALAALRYEAPVDALLQGFKFNGRLALGVVAAELLARICSPRAVDALIPIPLHRSRLRERGFNQSLLLARQVAQGRPILQFLQRQRATAAQSGLDGDERRRNVRGAFRVQGDLPPRVALIDDVMTTGATLAEAAKVCKKAGAVWVEVWVVARRP